MSDPASEIKDWAEPLAAVGALMTLAATVAWRMLTAFGATAVILKRVETMEKGLEELKAKQESLTWNYIDVMREMAEKPNRKEFQEAIESLREDIRLAITQGRAPQRKS